MLPLLPLSIDTSECRTPSSLSAANVKDTAGKDGPPDSVSLSRAITVITPSIVHSGSIFNHAFLAETFLSGIRRLRREERERRFFDSLDFDRSNCHVNVCIKGELNSTSVLFNRRMSVRGIRARPVGGEVARSPSFPRRQVDRKGERLAVSPYESTAERNRAEIRAGDTPSLSRSTKRRDVRFVLPDNFWKFCFFRRLLPELGNLNSETPRGGKRCRC